MRREHLKKYWRFCTTRQSLAIHQESALVAGYTLIEILVVLIIAGILSSIAIPSFLNLLDGCFLSQDSCINEDPVDKGCGGDAKTRDTGSSGEILVQLRYSPDCHMTWPRVFARDSSSIAGTQIYVVDDEGNKYGFSTVRGGYNNYYGDMGPGYAVGACAVLPNAKKVCTQTAELMML